MLLRCLKAEGIKCRRAPVWLAFLVLPLFPAALGTVNYLGNLEVLEDGWYSLWTQHTLFASMFFLPAQFGVFCAWQWRLEHIDHNWNRFLTAPVPIRDLCLAKLVLSVGISLLAQGCIGALYVLSGRLAGVPGPLPPELPEWMLMGARGAAPAESGDPGLCPAGGHRPGGRHFRLDGHQPGAGVRLSLLPAVPGDAGQRPQDGAGPDPLPALCAPLHRDLYRPVHPLPRTAGRRGGVGGRSAGRLSCSFSGRTL